MDWCPISKIYKHTPNANKKNSGHENKFRLVILSWEYKFSNSYSTGYIIISIQVNGANQSKKKKKEKDQS